MNHYQVKFELKNVICSLVCNTKITNFDIRRRQLHNTTIIVNKLTRCAHNIQKHSLGSNSLTLNGVMIPVGVNLIVFVLFVVIFVVYACRKSTVDIFIVLFISMSVCFEVNIHQSMLITFVLSSS